MSQSENESLSALEHLLEEFFTHSTVNKRKHEIELQLNAFSNQRDCWKSCIYFLTHTSSHYVSMYALSTIEFVINRQWVSLEWEQRVQLKSALYNYLIEQNGTSPHFLRCKLAKLIVDIARFDWPHFYPDFFSNIIQLLQSNHCQLLGLIMLRTTSEEFMNPRPDLNSCRKEELTKLLQHHIPQIFQILCAILENLGTKPRHAVTATPPPSPTHPQSAPDLSREITAASFRPDNKNITREALAVAQHLFTWAPLTQVPVPLIKSIFYFTNISTYAQDDDDMCVLAMSALNELLYRKCVPPGTQILFTQLYHHAVQLLKDIVCPTSCKIETLGNDYIDKLSELLTLLIEQHLWRLEAESEFCALEFLSLLFQLMVRLPTIQCYMRCLNIWIAFVKQLKPQSSNNFRYLGALLGLVSAVLNKLQFTSNQAQLEEICNTVADDENETEWDVFLKTSTEVIAMIAEHAPTETFNQVLIPWNDLNHFYCIEASGLDAKNPYNKCGMTKNTHCMFKDLSSLTQVLARLSTLFVDQDSDYCKSSAPLISSLLSKLFESAYIATSSSYYKINDLANVNDFIEIHSQILAALKIWSPWMPLNDEINGQHLKQLLDITLPLLLGKIIPNYDIRNDRYKQADKVFYAAAQLLLNLSNTVFPPTLIVQPAVVEFIRTAPSLTYPIHVKEIINNAACNLLIRPWGEISQTDSLQRNMLIEAFFSSLVRDFRQLTPSSPENLVTDVTKYTLHCLTQIIEFAKHFPSQSKKVLYSSLKSTIDFSLEIFSIYSKCPEVSESVLMLFLNVLKVLQHQLGVENIKCTIQVFLDVALRNQQSINLWGLDTLLKILQIVVESPGASYKCFLSDILQLCMQQVYPFIVGQANEQPDVFIALLTLLHSILVHRWQYFYISQVRLGHSPGCSERESGPDNLQQPDQLLAVLQVFGQALLQLDINIFRTSLAALEDLNTKWKLYHKLLFRDQLLNQFLVVLLNTLLDKTHELLTEDIMLAIYNMASVNFHVFFNTFLTGFLQNMEGLGQQQRDCLKQSFRQETDMPTFIQHFQRFINDLRCYQLCNASLPLGSVVL